MFARMNIDPAGVFVIRSELVDATDDEVLAHGRGELPKDRAEALSLAMFVAARTLYMREARGRC